MGPKGSLTGAGTALIAFVGCGGGVPLMHPAHVLKPGDVTMGAGLSGQIALAPRAVPTTGDRSAIRLEELTVASGVAPWLGGRVGIDGDYEAGITYTARTLRIDARRAFPLGVPTLSVGLGASAIIPEAPHSGSASSVFGGGLDLPILIGITSRSDVYSVWAGPRAGIDFMRGSIDSSDLTTQPVPQATLVQTNASHEYVGLVAGVQVGFRHLHVALELSGAFHHAAAKFGDASVAINQGTLSPAGALIVAF
jgi:hypothetical protein